MLGCRHRQSRTRRRIELTHPLPRTCALGANRTLARHQRQPIHVFEVRDVITGLPPRGRCGERGEKS